MGSITIFSFRHFSIKHVKLQHLSWFERKHHMRIISPLTWSSVASKQWNKLLTWKPTASARLFQLSLVPCPTFTTKMFSSPERKGAASSPKGNFCCFPSSARKQQSHSKNQEAWIHFLLVKQSPAFTEKLFVWHSVANSMLVKELVPKKKVQRHALF